MHVCLKKHINIPSQLALSHLKLYNFVKDYTLNVAVIIYRVNEKLSLSMIARLKKKKVQQQ